MSLMFAYTSPSVYQTLAMTKNKEFQLNVTYSGPTFVLSNLSLHLFLYADNPNADTPDFSFIYGIKNNGVIMYESNVANGKQYFLTNLDGNRVTFNFPYGNHMVVNDGNVITFFMRFYSESTDTLLTFALRDVNQMYYYNISNISLKTISDSISTNLNYAIRLEGNGTFQLPLPPVGPEDPDNPTNPLPPTTNPVNSKWLYVSMAIASMVGLIGVILVLTRDKEDEKKKRRRK